ncbi:MAG: right-handed parallel beta-helix repeat-containing protein [Bryobacteraceae bacterium]|nr:right-handed parallel beta-helix repeat-containing protein [Bryobacteraceae bacterium]
MKIAMSALMRMLLAAFVLLASAAGKTYYVDGAAGNDANDGLSEAKAWKSLEKVNRAAFEPGDRILFKAGTSFTGQLRAKGSGREGSPIVVDMFGTGEKPLIAAEGKFREALLVENQDFWEISNLQLTNTGAKREPFRYGVRVRAWDYGTMRHIHLKNLFVRDVNGSLVKKDKGEGHGITWENGGDKVQSRFDGLLIEGCHLVRTDRNGICGFVTYEPEKARALPSLNLVIRKNLLEDIGGDAIKVWGAKGALVEHNVVRGSRTRCDDYAAGIWPWASDDTLIQFNEVSGVKGMKDGQAFDSDAHTTNTIFQYNYTHDNEGGFMLVCCYENSGTVIRYNISRNDRERLFHMAGSNDNVDIYNNVFYVGKGIDIHLFLWTGGRNGWTRDARIFNNIFYIEGVGRNSSGEKRKPIDDGTFISRPGFGGATNITFERNVMYGNFQDVPADWKKMVVDPKLMSPGSGGDGFASLDGYKLSKDSPAIGAGRPAKNNGGRDFWGNKVPDGKNPSIGAHEAAR